MVEYIHRELDEEVRFIAGSYSFTEEKRFVLGDRTVLCRIGIATVDNSCCGNSGCLFIRVAGYVTSWMSSRNSEGLPVSIVDPLVPPEDRAAISALLKEEHPYAQVYFDTVES